MKQIAYFISLVVFLSGTALFSSPPVKATISVTPAEMDAMTENAEQEDSDVSEIAEVTPTAEQPTYADDDDAESVPVVAGLAPYAPSAELSGPVLAGLAPYAPASDLSMPSQAPTKALHREPKAIVAEAVARDLIEPTKPNPIRVATADKTSTVDTNGLGQPPVATTPIPPNLASLEVGSSPWLIVLAVAGALLFFLGAVFGRLYRRRRTHL